MQKFTKTRLLESDSPKTHQNQLCVRFFHQNYQNARFEVRFSKNASERTRGINSNYQNACLDVGFSKNASERTQRTSQDAILPKRGFSWGIARKRIRTNSKHPNELAKTSERTFGASKRAILTTFSYYFSWSSQSKCSVWSIVKRGCRRATITDTKSRRKRGRPVYSALLKSRSGPVRAVAPIENESTAVSVRDGKKWY